jgi:hypothetical protein
MSQTILYFKYLILLNYLNNPDAAPVLPRSAGRWLQPVFRCYHACTAALAAACRVFVHIAVTRTAAGAGRVSIGRIAKS